MKSLSISEKANKNYLGKIVKIDNLRPHSNANRLLVTTIDFQTVIVGINTRIGDIYAYFPVESSLNLSFLSVTNSFRDKELNVDKTQSAFFEKRGRIRAVRLRNEASNGYLVPISEIEKFAGVEGLSDHVGEEFDTVGTVLLCEKYFVPTRVGGQKLREGKKPRISRLVEGQVRLHVDTENLRKNAFMVSPSDTITISYKVHGTSGWIANVIGNRKLNLIEKALKFVGVKVVETEYEHFFGTRRVVKNQYETQDVNDFYDSDLWGEVKEELKEFVPKGYTLYYEILGYTKSGSAIQSRYDYGCRQGEHKVQVYRITVTNPDGVVVDLSTPQVQEFCQKHGLGFIHVFYHGKAKDLYPELDTETHWRENFIKNLERDYNEKACFMCVNKVWEEGIVLRKEKLHEFIAFKLKSFAFLEYETKLMDEEVSDIENEN